MFSRENFKKASYYWYNGKFYHWDEATIHPMTHALHYGTAVFEGIRAYDTGEGVGIFRLDEHVDRLFHSAKVVGMKIPYKPEEVKEVIRETLYKNNLKSAYIRPIFFYSYGNLGLCPTSCNVDFIVATWEWGTYLGEKALREGIRVLILPWRRIHHSQITTTAKISGIYVQSKIGSEYARHMGFNEGLFLNLEGEIAEGAGENIFIVKNRRLITNDWQASILEGITRGTVIQLAKDYGYSVEIRPILREDLFTADEAFFTGTAAEIVPIVAVADSSKGEKKLKEIRIGSGKPGEVTLHLAGLYRDVVMGKIERYRSWISICANKREKPNLVQV